MKLFEIANPKPFVFVDMDGVLADFDQAIEKYDGFDKESRVNSLRKLGPRGVKDFFASMSPLPDGIKLIEWLNGHDIEWRILSAPLRSDGVDPKDSRKASEIGKKDWLATHLGWEVAKKAIFEPNKWKWANYGHQAAILIDDTPKKIDAFNSAGGIGMLYTNLNSVLPKLKQIFHSNISKKD